LKTRKRGCPHHFPIKMKCRDLKNFRILSLKLDEFVDKEGKLHSHWEALAEKQL